MCLYKSHTANLNIDIIKVATYAVLSLLQCVVNEVEIAGVKPKFEWNDSLHEQTHKPESQVQQKEKVKIQFKIDGSIEINGETTKKKNGKDKPIVSENNKKILRKLVDSIGEYLTEWEIRDIAFEETDCVASNNLRVAICQLNNLLDNAIDTQQGNKRLKTFAKYRLNKSSVEIIKK